MKIKMGKGIGISLCIFLIGWIGAMAAGLYSVDELEEALRHLAPVAVAILIHESGHLLIACLLGVKPRELCLSLFGARLRLSGMLSYRRELLIAAAGPAANLVTAAFLLIPLILAGEGALEAYLTAGGVSATFALASVGLAGINLLPVRSLDGGRILHCFLAEHAGAWVADIAVRVGTALALGAMWCFSVYALLRVGEMLSLFAFSFCLLLRMMERE